MIENKTENKEIMEQESPTTETPEMTAEVNTEATEDVIVEAGAVCDEADEIIVDEAAEESGEDTLVVETAAPVKKGRRRSIALIAAIICMLAVAVGGTYAYYTVTSDPTVNVISMRGLDLVLHEEDEQGNQWGEAKEDEAGNKWREVNGVMPSNSIWKKVYVENYLEKDEPAEAKADFFTRVKVSVKVVAKDGTTLEEYVGTPEDPEDPDSKYEGYVRFGHQAGGENKEWHRSDCWTFNKEDGYYYYTKDDGVVKPGEKTESIFDFVTFDKTMGNAYQNCKVYMDIEAEATQSKNNPGGDPMDANTAW